MPYTKQQWLDEIIDLSKPIIDPTTGKQKVDPQTGRLLFEAVQSGTRVTAERMNHMEDGIESANSALDEATPGVTPDSLMVRDANGRAKVAAPVADDDIARLDTVRQAIADLIAGAPGALDTLKELADALGDDANFAATITNALAQKVANTDPAYTAIKNGTYVQPGAGIQTTPGTNQETVSLAPPSGNNIGGVKAGAGTRIAQDGTLTVANGFPNLLDPSRQSFSRASNATKKDLSPVPYNVLRTEMGKFGQGAFIEEATTNLVYNSDFETVTGTATVFSDPLTSYSGSTAASWTVQAGSFTFGASGATSGASASLITAGNSAWKPLTGSNGTALTQTVQATFTTPASGGTVLAHLGLTVNLNNGYYATCTANSFYIEKLISGGYTTLTSVAQTISASTTYTITLSITPSGGLTAKLYSGTGTNGTLLQTLTATDTSLTGGFLIGVGGDTGVVIKSAQVTAPFADGWNIGGDSRVAWGLTGTNPISGNYSVSAVGVASGINGELFNQGTGYSTSTTYTFSGFISTNGVGSGGADIHIDFGNNTSPSNTTPISGTTQVTRYSKQAVSPSTLSSNPYVFFQFRVHDAGTFIFDAAQIEQKAYATTYVRNDSTTSSATRQADSLSYALGSPLPSRYFGALVWKPEQASSTFISTDGIRVLYSEADLAVSSQRRWIQYMQPSGVIRFAKYPKGSTQKNLETPPIVFDAGDTLFVAWLDDPVAGNMYLWYAINGGTLQQVSLVNSETITDAQKVYIGLQTTGGNQCNGTIDFPIITDVIPTSEQVQALYAAQDWGGMRNYPGTLPDKVSIGKGAFIENLSPTGLPFSGGVNLVSTVGDMRIGGIGTTWLTSNCYYDSVSGNWYRYDTSKSAQALVTRYDGYPPSIYTAPPGTGAITWQQMNNIAQILSGGYKIQSGGGVITTVANGVVSTTITFPTIYTSAPIVFASLASTVSGSDKMWIAAYNPTTTQFSVTIGSTVAQNTYFQWLAIGS